MIGRSTVGAAVLLASRMIQNFTLRVLIGAAVGVAVWFILTRAIGGMTNVEVGAILILAIAASVATIVGLGRKGRSSIQPRSAR